MRKKETGWETWAGGEGKAGGVTKLLNLYCEIHEICSLT